MKVIGHINKFKTYIAGALLVALSGIYVCDLACSFSPTQYHEKHDTGGKMDQMTDMQAQQNKPGHSDSRIHSHDQESDMADCCEQAYFPLFFGKDFKHSQKYIDHAVPATNYLSDLKCYVEDITIVQKPLNSNVLLPPKIPNVRIFIQSFLN